MMSGSFNGNLVGDYRCCEMEGMCRRDKGTFRIKLEREWYQSCELKAKGLIELCEKWGDTFRAQTSNE